jgi:hypothetical protein
MSAGGSDGKTIPVAHRLRRPILLVGGGLLAIFLALQLVPYGWTKSNPPVTQDAPWPSPEAEAIARTSCYDCHSNETDRPAYSYVAPMSWLVRRDVEAGRKVLNFSEWDRDTGKIDEAADTVEDGEMPLANYTRIHSDARLTDEEAATLVAALEQMADGSDDGGRGRGRGGGHSGEG